MWSSKCFLEFQVIVPIQVRGKYFGFFQLLYRIPGMTDYLKENLRSSSPVFYQLHKND